MGQISGALTVGQDLWSSSPTPLVKVGSLGLDEYGNKYRYVKNGAVALVTGNLLQEPAEDTQFDNMATTAHAIGVSAVVVTLGSTATTANMLDEGTFQVSYGTGIGQLFRILSHTVASGAATCTFTLDRPLKIALDTTSKITVRKNPYNGVIQSPITTHTGGVVGVALYAMSASTSTVPVYGWIQSGGESTVLFDTGTDTSNGVTGIGPSLAVAGSVKPQTGGEGGVVIGFARQITSTDTYQGIAHLTID